MKKNNLIRLAQVDPIEIEQKTNSFFNKGTQFLLGANLVVLVLIYFVIFNILSYHSTIVSKCFISISKLLIFFNSLIILISLCICSSLP